MDEPAGATAWNKARIEALGDGAFAIVMTLLVLKKSLTELVKQGLIDWKDPLARTSHPEELERLLT